MSVSTSTNRIAIIGAGHVGATVAYALMLREIAGEIVLLDTNAKLAEAQALDIEHANALSRPARIWSGGYADAAGAAIVVLTAGAVMKTAGESRLSLVDRSAAIVRACVSELIAAGFAGIIVVAANPVDVMAHVAQELSGLPVARVLGSGTLLDSARLRSLLGAKLGLDPRSVFGYVLGEHGDSEVAAFSIAAAGGVPLGDVPAGGEPIDMARMQEDVRRAGYLILDGKGYTSFGVASAVTRICEAIVYDEHAVLPVSTLMTGEYGISGVYMSLPCVLHAGGVEAVLTPPLGAADVDGLRVCAAILSSTRAALAAAQARPPGSV